MLKVNNKDTLVPDHFETWCMKWLNNTTVSKLSLVIHCVKSARIRGFSGPHFTAFELNVERTGASLRIQSECGKMQSRKTPNTDTFHAVIFVNISQKMVFVLSKLRICLRLLIKSFIENYIFFKKLLFIQNKFVAV